MSNTCAVFDCRDPGHPVPVASFGLDEIGNGHLAYGRFYVDKAVAFALGPIHLPLSNTIDELTINPAASLSDTDVRLLEPTPC